MYRQSPSRNQRSKGVKVKYAIQICLLLAVSFWLIYQVKHSHDKKKEFNETEAKASLHMHNSNGKKSILGRKGINAQDDEITSMNGDRLHESIEEEENVEEKENKQEEDENKPEEDENKPEDDENQTEEDENKPEEDENKPEEDEHEEKNIDLEQENSDADENEPREVDSGDGQTEGEKSLFDDNDHDGNVNNNKSTREARDENYKADDASSAVAHEARTETGENVNVRKENSNEHPEINVLEDNKEVRKDLEVEGGKIASIDQKSNVMISVANGELLDSSENGSPPNDTLIIENFSRDLTSNGSAEVEIDNHDLSKSKLELDNNDSEANGFDSNSTDSTKTKDVDLQESEDFSNSSNNSTESLLPDSSVGTGNKTDSSSEMEDEMEVEKSDLNIDTYEKSESTVTENPEEEIKHDDGIDESDASDLLEEKHVRDDLDTLPEIQTEETESEDDVAAE